MPCRLGGVQEVSGDSGQLEVKMVLAEVQLSDEMVLALAYLGDEIALADW